MKAAIRTGRHPAVWMQASRLVICQPGKDDYTQLKAYRSISLLSCMGKVVETVVPELLSEKAERRGLLSDGQFGSRKGRSAINAGAIMVDRAHTAGKTVFSPVRTDPVWGRAQYGPVKPERHTGPDHKQAVLDWTGLVWTSPFLLMVVIQIRYGSYQVTAKTVIRPYV